MASLCCCKRRRGLYLVTSGREAEKTDTSLPNRWWLHNQFAFTKKLDLGAGNNRAKRISNGAMNVAAFSNG